MGVALYVPIYFDGILSDGIMRELGYVHLGMVRLQRRIIYTV